MPFFVVLGFSGNRVGNRFETKFLISTEHILKIKARCGCLFLTKTALQKEVAWQAQMLGAHKK